MSSITKQYVPWSLNILAQKKFEVETITLNNFAKQLMLLIKEYFKELKLSHLFYKRLVKKLKCIHGVFKSYYTLKYCLKYDTLECQNR